MPENKIDRQTLEFMMLCHNVFHLNRDGKKLFELLLDYCGKSSFGPDKSSNYAFFQEGQRNIILQLKIMIDTYKAKLEQENKKGGGK